MEIEFLGCKCIITKEKYCNGRTALGLTEVDTGEPFATATVNLPEINLAQNEIAIKNYSENEGILQVLIDAGVIGKPKYEIQSGFVSIPVCELKI